MAPIAVTPPRTSAEIESQPKPTVYVMDKFDPAAISRANELFQVIMPGTEEHKLWRQKAQYLLIRSSYLGREDVENCPNLLAIGKQGVGTDKIDSEACSERGVKVFNTPGVNARAVAELVLSLTMSLARQVRSISLYMAAGKVMPKEQCSGLIMHKSTIGIIGMGNIGRTVAQIFRGAFESNIVAYDPYMPEDAWSEIPHKRVKSVEDMLGESDILTIHVPLTPQTRDLIAMPQLRKMKRNTIVINTARGGIVNESDLCEALEQNLIWGAGLDCHEQEPPTLERYQRLWKHPNVISLPHVGAATAQTQRETAVAAVDRLWSYVKVRHGIQ